MVYNKTDLFFSLLAWTLQNHTLHFFLNLLPCFHTRAGICKCLWSPGLDSEESISPAYVAWRVSTTNRVSYRPARLRIDTWSP